MDPHFSRVLTSSFEWPFDPNALPPRQTVEHAKPSMAFNKNKALESALKYLNQGKIAQAIGEYQQILRHDSKDQATLMTVGDLFARQGDMPQAIEYFERLAQVYLNDGFNSKAIAIYKKIAKLAPNELTPLERLADLYVQQGVLSEARPLFLQIAEAHLKANRAPKAVEVLHRLLNVEPDNPRVQMRLAELYNVMGHKKEAGQTYYAYAQRLFERNETEEALKLIERALEVDPANAPARLLKAKSLDMTHKSDQAISLLADHPEADDGGEVSQLLIDLKLKTGQFERAADRARKQLARGSGHFGMMQKVVDTLIESGEPAKALPLLRELRGPMIEASEQDKYLKSLTSAAEKLPGEIEPVEMIADFCRYTGDPLPLSGALSQLVDLYAAAGDYPRAEELMEELIERNKDDERLLTRRGQLLARRNGGAQAQPVEAVPTPVVSLTGSADAAPGALAKIVEEAPLDEETQRFIAQALTDVDLFSSYGLTQKATTLLEGVIQRAPRHTPALERLLDFYLGAANDVRTIEVASQLEQIHRERGDSPASERFSDIRQRFQKLAGMPVDEPVQASPAPQAPAAQSPVQAPAEFEIQVESASSAPVNATPVEFEIPMATIETEPVQDSAVAPVPIVEPAVQTSPVTAPAEEVDLSDEWEAMISGSGEPAPKAEAEVAVSAEPAATKPEATAEAADEPIFELVDESPEQAPTPEAVAAGNGDLELELAPEPGDAANTDDFLKELAAEVDDMEMPQAPANLPAPVHVPVARTEPIPAASAEPVSAETLNELSEVFQEFRSELDEIGDEDEDLETHYNLGIAYREMGLLDEAISEFQRVANAIQKGKPFRYAMNCATLLALSFSDKNEPKIAALWYQRALETPGLDQETVLALRYDLGVSLSMAGESTSALDSFRQVYAMNIDYRDVADRIAELQKH
jgi:tetratricopeptide (TPR) repeat protein